MDDSSALVGTEIDQYNNGEAVYCTLRLVIARIAKHVLIVLLTVGLLGACRKEAGTTAQPSSSSPDIRTEEYRDAQGTLVSTSTFYIDGHGDKVLHGRQLRWSDGRKYQEADYVNGERHGGFTEWNPVFVYKVREGHYDRGKMHGRWVVWDSNGQVVSESFYRHGIRVGQWTTWWCAPGKNEKRQKQSVCIYKNGHIDGTKVCWNEKGSMIREERYDDSGHLREVTRWHNNGQRECQGAFSAPEDDDSRGFSGGPPKEGVWTYWNDKGQVVAEGTWKNGEPWDGVCSVPAAGDAGSAFGIDVFGQYKDGKLVQRISGSLAP